MENICYFLCFVVVIKEDTFARIKGKPILLKHLASLILESCRKCVNYPLYMDDKMIKTVETEANCIHIYMTAHFPGLVNSLL
jgi:hypothetical protein